MCVEWVNHCDKTASGADIPARQVASLFKRWVSSLFKRWVSGVVLAHGHGARIATTGRDDTPVHRMFEGLSCGEADEAVAAFNSEVEWAAECRLNNTYAGSLMKVSGCKSKMKPTFWCVGPFRAIPQNSHSWKVLMYCKPGTCGAF